MDGHPKVFDDMIEELIKLNATHSKILEKITTAEESRHEQASDIIEKLQNIEKYISSKRLDF